MLRPASQRSRISPSQAGGNGRRTPLEQLPRERLIQIGPGSLTDAELLALVLAQGSPGESTLRLTRRLVAGAGGLARLARRRAPEWTAEPGIGDARAALLCALFEITRRLRVRAPRRGQVIRRPRDLAAYLRARWGDESEECFGAMLLDARHRLIGERLLSRGGWSASVVRPREIFRQALLVGAPAVILYHNHPSGDPTPSHEDVQITRQVAEAGDLLGIRVLDHLVLGTEGFASLKERGLF